MSFIIDALLPKISNTNAIKDNKIKLAFEKTIRSLVDAGKNIHIIYPAPKMNVNPPLHKARLRKLGIGNNDEIIRLSHAEYKKQSLKSYDFLDTISNKYKLNKIYISDFLKDKNNDFIANNEDFIFYRDDNHLSLSGSAFITKNIVNKILQYSHR